MVRDQQAISSPDARLERGRRTKAQILERAVDIASTEGLDRLSLGRIAADLSLSKSGVNGHFADRTDLQLAVIGRAADLYVERVALPAWELPAGLERVTRFCELWIALMRDAVLTGRCFFLTAMVEFDARPGLVRDELARLRKEWGTLFVGAVYEAERLGEILPGTDAEQVFFETLAWISAAVIDSQLLDDVAVFERAERSIQRRLSELANTKKGL